VAAPACDDRIMHTDEAVWLMSVDLFVDYLIGVSPEIDEKLHQFLDKASKTSSLYTYLYSILDEFISRGGKRVRPAMTMLACEAVGGEPRKALASGCAIEFFHAAALIHDDIMDASIMRRDQKCAHIIHGTIVVRDPGLTDATKLAVLDVIGEMSARTVEGQALDVGWVRDDVYDLTTDDYLDMALGKTGYYSGIAPLKVGAIIGGATAEERKALVAFGKNSSIAFQIQDDLLNIVGDEQTLGKDFLNDVLESKRTLMIIHCLEQAEAADKKRLVELLRVGHDKSHEEVMEVVGLLRRYDSVGFARSLARNLIVEAGSYLSVLRESAARDVLMSMADFFLDREH
jgi:geranylgeranyl diphosphate synthase type I